MANKRFIDFPDLGAVTDDARIGGARGAGSGMFGISAVMDYVSGRVATVPSVAQFGAFGDNVTDDVLAFEAAAAASLDLLVPAGSYHLSRPVNPQGRDVTWRLATGATIIEGADFLGGTVVRAGRINRQTFGTFEQGTVLGLSNLLGDTRPGVTGFTADSQQSSYQTRDGVVLYADAMVPPPIHSSAGAAVYTATTATSGAPATVAKLRKDMFVHTRHNPFYSGKLVSWNADGSTLTVTGWYAQGNTATGQIPPNGTPFDVVATSAAWAANFNVHLAANSYSPAGQGGAQAHGLEVGTWNNKEAFNTSTLFPRMTGVDVIDFGAHGSYAGYAQRGQHYFGYQSYGARRVGYVVGDNTTLSHGPYAGPEFGFLVEAPSATPFAYSPGGVPTWSVTPGGGMELGNITAGGAVAVDFHTKAGSGDYDARILAYQAGANAEMAILAATLHLPRLNPHVDGSQDLGTPALRWGNAWVANLVASGNIEVGNAAGGGIAAVDFHSTIGSGDWDARIQAEEVSGNTHLSFQADALAMVAPAMGFYSGIPVAKPTVTGSRGGNAALASLLTALASMGLITNSTSA